MWGLGNQFSHYIVEYSHRDWHHWKTFSVVTSFENYVYQLGAVCGLSLGISVPDPFIVKSSHSHVLSELVLSFYISECHKTQ